MHEKIKKLIADKLLVDVKNITNETKLSEITEDSIDRIDLLFEIEQLIDKKIPEEDILNMETVGDILHSVNKIL